MYMYIYIYIYIDPTIIVALFY